LILSRNGLATMGNSWDSLRALSLFAQPFDTSEGLLFGLSWPWLVLAALGLLLLALVVYFWLVPYRALRLVLAFLMRSFFWLRVHGGGNVPGHGGALLVCHSINYLDILFLQAALWRRIRFVIFAGWVHRFWPRRLLRWLGAIVIDGDATPRDVVKALRSAGEAIKRGHLVCVFGESGRTRHGLELPFSRVFPRLTRDLAAPIIPVCLHQPRASIFEVHSGQVFWSWPKELPSAVEVAFGAPLPSSARAGEVRQAVQVLSAERAIAATPKRKPVHRQFVRMAHRRPRRPCIIDSMQKDRPLTYGKALTGAILLSRALRPLVGDTQMVAVWLPPGIGGALTNIALALLHKTSANLNYTSSPAVVQSALRQCGSRLVVTARRFTERIALELPEGVQAAYLDDILPRVTSSQRFWTYLAVLLLPGWILEHWYLGLGGHGPDDLATVIFSSGSTGEPKGVMLTHGNVAGNVESMIQAIALKPDDRILGVLPLFHSFGYTVTLWVPMQIGALSIFHADPRQAREIGELSREEKATIFLTTPTFLRFCQRKCDEKDFVTLRLLVCGAEKLPLSLAGEFHKKFGVLPMEGYGCTEMSPVVSTNLPDEEIDSYCHIRNKPGSIGPPIAGVVARILHPETLEPLATGEEGLVSLHGPNVMKGYLGKEELTAQVLRDGWYTSGDMGRIDDDGFITLTGRLSRFAKVGGEMVPLERIEDELHEILRTTERVCAVTCVPDDARGERLVVLYLRIELTVGAWREQLSQRGLPNLWMPAERDFYIVSELPLLGSGKINLKQIKEIALSLVRK
jgi:acyl-[acyl-carrier-protein]-phospholipid O-acyltransferase/long-chain-fatty-acid--[acyl-carrier-protein] ligase